MSDTLPDLTVIGRLLLWHCSVIIDKGVYTQIYIHASLKTYLHSYTPEHIQFTQAHTLSFPKVVC